MKVTKSKDSWIVELTESEVNLPEMILGLNIKSKIKKGDEK